MITKGSPMVGNLLKQAQKMQQQVQEMQCTLATTVITIANKSNTVQVQINGKGDFCSLSLDESLLEQDKERVATTILMTLQEASQKARDHASAEMAKITGGLNMPNLS